MCQSRQGGIEGKKVLRWKSSGGKYIWTHYGHGRRPWRLIEWHLPQALVVPELRCGQWGGHELKLCFLIVCRSNQNCMSQSRIFQFMFENLVALLLLLYFVDLNQSIKDFAGFLQFMFKLGFHEKVKPRKP
jgi:hypothetical protein